MWLLIHMSTYWIVTGISEKEKVEVNYLHQCDLTSVWPKQQGYLCNQINGQSTPKTMFYSIFIFAVHL